MNYNDTLTYLFDHLPMYQRIGAAAYKKDLTNTIKLCEILGNPQEKIKCIHVGGTNGKGSVSNMLASILMEAGYSTGLYTSPHLFDFRERIRVNGKVCEEKFVVDFVERMKPHLEEIQPSFFEITVAMAFEYFAEQKVDIAIIEVGLGGRLDSTNIITPILSVITNISFDHMQMLGNTLKEIAFEKAGIIKHQVPVVIGEFNPETFPVFLEKAAIEESAIYLAEQNISVDIVEQSFDHLEVHVSYLNQLIYPDLVAGLTGAYQLSNIKTVIQSIEIMRELEIDISEDAVYDGIKNVVQNTGFAGRFQIISKQPLLICDCAHNADGLKKLFSQVAGIKHETLRIITGMVSDKDIDASLRLYPTEAAYYFCMPAIPRGLAADTLQLAAGALGLHGSVHQSVKAAVTAAQGDAGTDDLILICGSIFVAAEALEFLSKQADIQHS